MAAILWKFVRVFAGKRELPPAERDAVAKHLRQIQSYSSWGGRAHNTPEQEEKERSTAEQAYDQIKDLRFRDRRVGDDVADLHWADVVFTFRRDLDEDDYVRMNLPVEFWNRYKVPDSIQNPLREYARKLDTMMKTGVGLYLFGLTGRGKTSAAAALAQIVRSYSRTVFFVTVSDLREMVRNRITFDEDQTPVERCKQIDFLVLDNLRAEDAKEAYVGALVLEDILRSRAASKRSTVVTSTMPASKLRDEFSASFAEIALGCCAFVEVIGGNLRSSKQNELKGLLGIPVPVKGRS